MRLRAIDSFLIEFSLEHANGICTNYLCGPAWGSERGSTTRGNCSDRFKEDEAGERKKTKREKQEMRIRCKTQKNERFHGSVWQFTEKIRLFLLGWWVCPATLKKVTEGQNTEPPRPSYILKMKELLAEAAWLFRILPYPEASDPSSSFRKDIFHRDESAA